MALEVPRNVMGFRWCECQYIRFRAQKRLHGHTQPVPISSPFKLSVPRLPLPSELTTFESILMYFLLMLDPEIFRPFLSHREGFRFTFYNVQLKEQIGA